MAKNTTHRDNAAIRVALLEVMTELNLHTIAKQFDGIGNPDIIKAMTTIAKLKTNLASGGAGSMPNESMKEVGEVAYYAVKGLSELSEEDIFTINMIDTTVMENFHRRQVDAGVHYE